MLFNFLTCVDDLRENPEKKEIIEKYEQHFWPIVWDLVDQPWYQTYVSTFTSMQYAVPEELQDDFDRPVFMELVACSFSSEWTIKVIEWQALPEFIISVKSWEKVVVKQVSELFPFQIKKLLEIYVEEQINLAVLAYEDEKEKAAIEARRQGKFQRWKLVIDNVDKVHMQKEHDAQKEEKLDDLMSQL